MAPWAGGAMGGQQPLEPQDAHLQAAIITGVKANAKQAADLWRAKEGAKFFISRGGFNMTEEINRALLLLVLDKVVHVSDKVITQLKALSEFAVEDFFPPVPAGETPAAMPADVHFTTFVAAFTESLEYGMEGAQAVCKNRVSNSRSELEAVQRVSGGLPPAPFQQPHPALGQGSRAAIKSNERRPHGRP